MILRKSLFLLLAAAAMALSLLLSSCALTPPASQPQADVAPSPALAALPAMGAASQADTPLGYRIEAAYHLYERNSSRIYHGVMPHYLYAIGVVEVQVDKRGQVLALNWLRAPPHAPEVVADIERTIQQAAPFPAPVRLGRASYVETWLWDASGRFQLHTLSEGQGDAREMPREAPPNPRAVRVVAAPPQR